MRFCLATNILSPHQMPLARELARRLGPDGFRYVATQAPSAERQRMGWSEDDSVGWLLQPEVDATQRREADAWCQESDVLLGGNRDVALFAHRVQHQRVTLYMSERWWKPPWGRLRLFRPRYARMAWRFRRLAESPFLHYLPIGSHAARDMASFAPFAGRNWLWGYFTETPESPPPVQPRRGPLNVLWVGRMIGWKRVDVLIDAIGRLTNSGCDAHLTLVGQGPMEQAWRRRGAAMGARIMFQPPVPIQQVRERMRAADVYVLPSDGGEGWGAALNEAMTEGCAVVACEAAGSAKTLIKDGENGLLFHTGDTEGLTAALKRLADDDALRLRIATAGQATIQRFWSPAVAAERLITLSQALLATASPPRWDEGPLMAVRGS